MTLVVRPVEATDIPGVTRLHRAAFPRQLTTALGRPVVRDYYARALDPTTTMRLVVAESGGRLVGFASTLLEPARFYSQYRRSRLKILLLALPAFASSPAIARKVAGAAARARESAAQPGDAIELSSIAVASEMRGTGVGTALMSRVREQALVRGGRLYLWTDLEDNERTLSFYRGLGFTEETERSFDGSRHLVRLSLDVSAPRPRGVST